MTSTIFALMLLLVTFLQLDGLLAPPSSTSNLRFQDLLSLGVRLAASQTSTSIASLDEPLDPALFHGQGKATGSSTNDERKSKYSPVKRRLRPIHGGGDRDTSFDGNNYNSTPSATTRESSPASLTLGGVKVIAKSSSSGGGKRVDQKQHQHERRSSPAIRRILMLARQGEASVVEELLVKLLSSQQQPSQREPSSTVTLKEFNLLLKELGDNGHLDHCDRILTLMSSRGGVVPSVVTYSTLISRAGTWQKVAMAEKYFHKMTASGIHADVQSYNCLVNAFVKSGQADRALDMIGVMDNAVPRIFPNIVTFNTLIDSHARGGDVVKARSILDTMKLRGIEPNALTYSSLIHACCQANAIDDALVLIERMQSEHLEPTDVTFSLLLHGLGQAGDLVRAFQVLEGMKRKGLRPNVVTMSSLVHACGKHGQLDRAFALYREMGTSTDSRYQPNSITCSSLIDACLKSGEVDRAFSVVQDMRARQLPMTQVTYTSLITELTKLRRLDRILEVIQTESVPSKGNAAVLASSKILGGSSFFPTSARSLSNALTIESEPKAEKDGDVLKALESFTAFLAQRHRRDTSSVLANFSSLLVALDRVAKGLLVLDERCLGAEMGPSSEDEVILSAAISSVQLFKSEETAKLVQLVLDVPSFNSDLEPSTLDRVCRHLLQMCGRGSRLLKLLNACRVPESVNSNSNSNTNTPPSFSWTVDTFSLLESSAREFRSKYSYTMEAYQWMKELKVTPCARIYNELLRSLNEKSMASDIGVEERILPQRRKMLKNDELFRLFLVFQEMRVGQVQVDAATYNTLINACASAGDLDRAIETVQDMQEQGVLPDVITYTSLIKACSISNKAGTVRLAEFYFSEMQQKSNHFSRYIEPTTYTYLQLMKTHLRAIEAGSDEGSAARIWSLMESLLRRQQTPTLRHWRLCVVAALFEGKIHKALTLLVVIRDQLGNNKIDARSWSACADFCAARGMTAEAARLRLEMK